MAGDRINWNEMLVGSKVEKQMVIGSYGVKAEWVRHYFFGDCF